MSTSDFEGKKGDRSCPLPDNPDNKEVGGAQPEPKIELLVLKDKN